MTYKTVDEIPENVIRDIGEGVAVLGRKLREWREWGSLESLTGRWPSADGKPFEITCDSQDRLWMTTATEPLELTALLDHPRK